MKNSNKAGSLAAGSFLHSIDDFILTDGNEEIANPPPVVNIPLFYSRRLLARTINRLVLPLLRIMRKSTTPFYSYQKQTNLQLLQKTKSLQKQVNILKMIVEELSEEHKR